MATAATTYTFAAATPIESAKVNTNFTDVVNFLNNSVIQTDGSKAMTAQLSLYGADPSTANHATRKQYVDRKSPTIVHNSNINLARGLAPSFSIPTTTTITDPGYDIELWGVAMVNTKPDSGLDLGNVWQLSVYVDSVLKSALRIPVVVNFQSLCTPIPFTVHTAGTNCTVTLKAERAGGSQAGLEIVGGSEYNWFDVYWRAH